MVGVVINDSDSAARKWDATVGVTWPVVGDPSGQIALAYGVHGQPETFVIDPSGKVVVYLSGPVTTSGLDGWLARAQAQEASTGA
jgi:cytochrome c biogenesis protein CcmG/thiol:disulfide interchange protein DsbE